ncbi:MAG: hypothetical protein GX665_12050 [Gammaproteobacteria bacterium]|nr:hypothetical protein [Gammaproteobacteria bacterium]
MPFPVHALPTVQGQPVKMLRYQDRTGDNLLVLTETNVYPLVVDEKFTDPRTKELYAYRFLFHPDGTTEQVWLVLDYSRDCELDGLRVEFIVDAVRITDLDGDQQAEIWLPYVADCTGDPGPERMKIIMYSGGQKYAMRGSTYAWVGGDEYAGGEYVMDAALQAGPLVFRRFADRLWQQHKAAR